MGRVSAVTGNVHALLSPGAALGNWPCAPDGCLAPDASPEQVGLGGMKTLARL
jgi:hypothetical protein